MRALFQINTVYQLLSAINMRLHKIPNSQVDLLISDHTPMLKDYIPHIKECGIFNNVFYIETLIFNKYFWSIDNDNKPSAFYNAKNELKKILPQDFTIYEDYDELYLANLDAYSKFIYSIYRHLNVVLIEDGAGTCATDWKAITKRWDYITGFNDIYDELKAIYLYTPELVQFDFGHEIRIIPQFNSNDGEVIDLFNYIFDYDRHFEFPEVVFVEEPFQVDDIKNNDLELMQLISEKIGYDNFFIKTHPRNTINRSKELGLGRQKDTPWPFELLLLNHHDCRSTFITIDSGSLISPRAVLGIRPQTVFLYKIVKGSTRHHGADTFIKYMDEYIRKYRDDKLWVPKSQYEFELMLDIISRQTNK